MIARIHDTHSLRVALKHTEPGSAERRLLFEDLTRMLDRDSASRLWWAAFAASDASET